MMVHVAYTWNRKRIRHIVVDPRKLVLHDMPNGRHELVGTGLLLNHFSAGKLLPVARARS